jgi:hypothetical protein
MRALGTDTCFWLSKQVQYNARFAEQSFATLPYLIQQTLLIWTVLAPSPATSKSGFFKSFFDTLYWITHKQKNA